MLSVEARRWKVQETQQERNKHTRTNIQKDFAFLHLLLSYPVSKRKDLGTNSQKCWDLQRLYHKRGRGSVQGLFQVISLRSWFVRFCSRWRWRSKDCPKIPTSQMWTNNRTGYFFAVPTSSRVGHQVMACPSLLQSAPGRPLLWTTTRTGRKSTRRMEKVKDGENSMKTSMTMNRWQKTREEMERPRREKEVKRGC